MSVACLYLGGKVEDTPKSVRDVLVASCELRYGLEAARRITHDKVSRPPAALAFGPRPLGLWAFGPCRAGCHLLLNPPALKQAQLDSQPWARHPSGGVCAPSVAPAA